MRNVNMEIQVVRRDKVEVELDPEYFNEEWFEDFRSVFYDFYDLQELAEYIASNVVSNSSAFVEGIGTPLRDGERPYWIDKEEEVNEHVNVIYNNYNTEIDYE